MKKLNWRMAGCMIACATFLVSTTSCKDDGEEPKLLVDTSEVTFTPGGESKTIRIESNTEWVITGYPGWLAVSPSSASGTKTVVMSALENTSTTSRSCQVSVATASGNLSHVIAVKQDATAATLSVDISQITLDGRSGASGSFRISSNSEWTISGAASWLSLSSTGGNGNAQIIVTAKSANDSSLPRECILTIANAADANAVATITISQSGLLAARCNVKPGVIVTLADGLASDFISDADVVYYNVGVWTARALERMTDAEVIAQLSEDPDDRITPQDGYVTSWRNLSPLTDYVLCSVGFDKTGQHGDLIRTNVRTKNDMNQAAAYISDVQYDDTYWHWTTAANGFTTRYYQMVVLNADLYYTTNAAIAWFFKDGMEKHPDKFPPIAKGDIWYYERNGGNTLHIVTWAVDVEGNFSGIIDRFRGQISSSDAPAVDTGNKSVQRVLTPKSANLVRPVRSISKK